MHRWPPCTKVSPGPARPAGTPDPAAAGEGGGSKGSPAARPRFAVPTGDVAGKRRGTPALPGARRERGEARVAPRLCPSLAPRSRALGPRRGAVGEVRAGAEQNNEVDGACPAPPCVCVCMCVCLLPVCPSPQFAFPGPATLLRSPVSQEFPPPWFLSSEARGLRGQRRRGTGLLEPAVSSSGFSFSPARAAARSPSTPTLVSFGLKNHNNYIYKYIYVCVCVSVCVRSMCSPGCLF